MPDDLLVPLKFADISPSRLATAILAAFVSLSVDTSRDVPEPPGVLMTSRLWALSLALLVGHVAQWEAEDKAREPTVSDEALGQIKRTLDRLNARRCETMNAIDREFFAINEAQHTSSTRRSYWTLGELLDRLAISSIRFVKVYARVQHQALSQGSPVSVQEAADDVTRHAEQLSEFLRAIANRECLVRSRSQLKLYAANL